MASVVRHGILGLLFAAAGGMAWPAAAATFESGECPKTHDPVPALKTARCGWLIVPENRTKPGSRSIRLPVVIVPAVDKKSNDPIAAPAGRSCRRPRSWSRPRSTRAATSSCLASAARSTPSRR